MSKLVTEKVHKLNSKRKEQAYIFNPSRTSVKDVPYEANKFKIFNLCLFLSLIPALGVFWSHLWLTSNRLDKLLFLTKWQAAVCSDFKTFGIPMCLVFKPPLYLWFSGARFLNAWFSNACCISTIYLFLGEELPDVPFFYQLDRLCSIMKVSVGKFVDFRSAILNAGFRVSISHCNKQAIKTDAPIDVSNLNKLDRSSKIKFWPSDKRVKCRFGRYSENSNFAKLNQTSKKIIHLHLHFLIKIVTVFLIVY